MMCFLKAGIDRRSKPDIFRILNNNDIRIFAIEKFNRTISGGIINDNDL